MTGKPVEPTNRDLVMFSAGAALYAWVETPASWPDALILFSGTALLSMGVRSLLYLGHRAIERHFHGGDA